MSKQKEFVVGANNSNSNHTDGSRNEQTEVMTFQFSESKQPVRNLLIEGKPWFVAKDVCDVLGLQNSNKSISNLDDDEKADVTFSYTSSNGTVQNRKVKAINESGLYALILRSNKPYARTFRKWITSEVIPAIQKNGYYSRVKKHTENYIDARDVPFKLKVINNYNVRYVTIDETDWYSLNDVVHSMQTRTRALSLARSLNAKRELAIKIFVFGATTAAWFTNELGVNLALTGSSKNRRLQQLQLFNEGGNA